MRDEGYKIKGGRKKRTLREETRSVSKRRPRLYVLSIFFLLYYNNHKNTKNYVYNKLFPFPPCTPAGRDRSNNLLIYYKLNDFIN
jgi:hypothetical protein